MIHEQEKLKFLKDVEEEESITLFHFAVLFCQVLIQGTRGAHPIVEAIMWTVALVYGQNTRPFIME
jgi:hypothetical protein